tara:strand:+ start:1678 stop:2067 length:390 start_codon:yes stop_codon:yes gene_type:complete
MFKKGGQMNTVGNRKRFTIKSVLKALGNHPKLGLERITSSGDAGYFIFTYEIEEGYSETTSIYVNRLSHMSIERWVEDGKKFINAMEEKKEVVSIETGERFTVSRANGEEEFPAYFEKKWDHPTKTDFS